MLRNPSSLILKLKGVGSWYLRKKRMDIVVNEWSDRGLVRPREEFESDNAYEKYLDKKTQYDNFVERLKEYDEYILIKRGVDEERRKTQFLITPSTNEEKFNVHED